MLRVKSKIKAVPSKTKPAFLSTGNKEIAMSSSELYWKCVEV